MYLSVANTMQLSKGNKIDVFYKAYKNGNEIARSQR